jgi:hypothetical protein
LSGGRRRSSAHLSDPHIAKDRPATAPALSLSRALDRVLAVDPRPVCVIISGDLVDGGSAREYAALRVPHPRRLGLHHRTRRTPRRARTRHPTHIAICLYDPADIQPITAAELNP